MSDLESRGVLPAGPQLRSYPAKYEIRGLAGSKVELRGYASTYEQPYEMFDFFGDYQEVARAGMCAKSIQNGADVAYLANHEGLTLARTKGGTLQLSEDSTGLLAVAQLNTTRTDARDLVTAIEDGAVSEMSFAFRILRQDWSPDFEQRDLIEVNLNKGDVSAVNYGANPYTSVGAVQRAFHSRQGADLYRMAVEVGEGKLSRQAADTLSRVLAGLSLTEAAGSDGRAPMGMGGMDPESPAEDAAEGDEECDDWTVELIQILHLRQLHEADMPGLLIGG